MSTTPKSGGKTNSTSSAEGFSEQERAAMKGRAAELRAETRRGRGAAKAAADETDVLAKIAEMPASDRALAERVHAVVTTAAPELAPKLYYGQPAYARKGKVVCFFRSGQMDKERYSTFGFSAVRLDQPAQFVLDRVVLGIRHQRRTPVIRVPQHHDPIGEFLDAVPSGSQRTTTCEPPGKRD